MTTDRTTSSTSTDAPEAAATGPPLATDHEALLGS